MIPEPVRRAVEAGYNVVPATGEKKPVVPWKRWQDRQQTRDEFDEAADRRVGTWAIVTGRQPSGVVVVDFDGEEGLATWRKLGLPKHVTTGSGGVHVYFHAPDWPVKSCARPLPDEFPGLDVRGEGGLAYFAGVSKKGKYRTHPPFPELLKPEDWPEVMDLFKRLERTASTANPVDFSEYTGPGHGTDEALKILEARARVIAETPEGGRNAVFNKAAYSVAGMAAGGALDAAFADARLREAAAVCGYAGEPEFEDVLEASWSSGAAEPWAPEPKVGVFDDDEYAEVGATPRKSRFRKASTIEQRPVDWLWKDRIPLNKMTLLAGDPSAGKTFVALALASAITNGARLPDDPQPPEPGSVLFVSFEDAPEDTLVGRAERMGADLDRLHFTSIEDAVGATEIAEIEADIHEIGDVRLLVIDPLGSFIGGKTDTGADNAVRESLRDTVALAERTGIAVLILAHLNKGDGKALYRILGSIGFTGYARTTLYAGEYEEQTYVVSGKNNLSAKRPALAYSIEDKDGPGTNTGVLVWGALKDGVTADMLTSHRPSTGPKSDSRLAEAEDFLMEHLGDKQPHPQKVLEDLAGQEGITKATLVRAKRNLAVVSKKDGPTWYWAWEGFKEVQR